MTGQKIARIAALADIARILLDARLNDLRKANVAREATLRRIAALDRRLTPPPDADISPMTMARTDLMYDKWVEGRRVELNRQLARETAAWLDQRAIATTALGRSEALKSLDEQLRKDLKVRTARLAER